MALTHRPQALVAALAGVLASLALLAPVASAAQPHARASHGHARVALASNEALTPVRLKVERQAGRTKTKPPKEVSSSSPPPPTTPPPAPAPAGVTFRGDQIRDFPIAQSAPGAITEALDPAGSGETVFKFTVSDNDGYPVTPTENPRAELISPRDIEAGDEFWWSAKFFLPAEFPAATPNFVTLLQGPFGPPAAGSPPFHIEANGGVLKWQRNATYGWDIPWQMPEIRSQWVEVMVHERFAANGFIELWIDGQPVTFFAPGSSYNPHHLPATARLEMATLDSSNDEGPQALFLQQYRKKGMYPSLTVYQGPLTIGTTREAVGG